MGKQTGCYADSIAANPNRPTVANPADITQYGVLELEYGWDRQWPEEGRQQASVGGLLKFGMLCDVELRWNTTSFLSQTDASGTHRSFGDNWLGPQIRVYRQTKRVPTLAFGYAVKIPSASTEDGLGTGHMDHAFTLLASKDIARFHFDFNVTQFLVGRPNTSGFDKNQQLNLGFHPSSEHGPSSPANSMVRPELTKQPQGLLSRLWPLRNPVVRGRGMMAVL